MYSLQHVCHQCGSSLLDSAFTLLVCLFGRRTRRVNAFVHSRAGICKCEAAKAANSSEAFVAVVKRRCLIVRPSETNWPGRDAEAAWNLLAKVVLLIVNADSACGRSFASGNLISICRGGCGRRMGAEYAHDIVDEDRAGNAFVDLQVAAIGDSTCNLCHGTNWAPMSPAEDWRKDAAKFWDIAILEQGWLECSHQSRGC